MLLHARRSLAWNLKPHPKVIRSLRGKPLLLHSQSLQSSHQRRCWQSTMSTTGNASSCSSSSLPPTPPPPRFPITAPFQPTGDQPTAIDQLVQQIQQGDTCSNLRGITGSGKTLVLGHVISRSDKPTLVLCHNKTLAAQLARELRAFLGHSAVELFVSYYQHYRPEYYVPTTGTYRSKKARVDPHLDTLRHRATRALLTRKDVVVVASVSCIYGMGLPEDYVAASTEYQVGERRVVGSCSAVEEKEEEEGVLEQLHHMLYEPSIMEDEELERGQYQVMDLDETRKMVTVWPPTEAFPVQMEFRRLLTSNSSSKEYTLHAIRQGTHQGFTSIDSIRLFPARHHSLKSHDNNNKDPEDAYTLIETELHERVATLRADHQHDAANRLLARTTNDLFLLRETGFCPGMENYSRHLSGRAAGEPPATLLDYWKWQFGNDWLLVVDESHVTLPQLKSMHAGDQARKRQLVQHGYRLPSALDHRPLTADEFWQRVSQTLCLSATPAATELEWAERPPVEMVIRPTFVCDPVIHVRPWKDGNQLEDLLREVKVRAARNERSLAITLTKRDSEDLASYLQEHGVKSTFLHSGLSTKERSNALRSLQSGEVDCLVGVNCLREGLDLPQVSLVAVLNADSEGFLRSDAALLQIVGRAARHIHGEAIFYANRVTASMKTCMDTTAARRQKQLQFNKQHGCIVRSTKGSTTMSFFDLLKEQIEEEQKLQNHAVATSLKNRPNPGRSSEQSANELPTVTSVSKNNHTGTIETDHIPSSPGVYFWKDSEGKILYIGKANKLRSRVKSYLSPKAKHGARIANMIQRATSVDIMLTPSERDALVLESNLIKHHQPSYNVLLKDDEEYPYICASVGDTIPRLSIVPRRQEGSLANSRYRYFGPYTNYREINEVLDGIEASYDLRVQSFLTRQGSVSKEEYNELFETVLKDVFGGGSKSETLLRMREKYEEAGLLFNSEYNKCRDVVTVQLGQDSATEAVVSVLQLRDGLVAGHFYYTCVLPVGVVSDEDFSSAAQSVLTERHYPSGQESPNGAFSWFPDSILMSHPPSDAKALKDVVRQSRRVVEPERKGSVSITLPASRGPRRPVDERVLVFATQNLKQQAIGSTARTADSAWDGRAAASELAELLALDGPPSRIECYDISHTQGQFPVGSRVVFVDGEPAPHLYRKFNVKTVDGIDDYASLEEVLERRFHHAWKNGEGGPVESTHPWVIPDLVVIDGGKGQLTAAVKGMSKASILPSSGLENISGLPFGQTREAYVPICALAKDKEQIFVHGHSDPVNDEPDSPAVLLLRAVRDESHRFALNAHRNRRSVRNVGR